MSRGEHGEVPIHSLYLRRNKPKPGTGQGSQGLESSYAETRAPQRESMEVPQLFKNLEH